MTTERVTEQEPQPKVPLVVLVNDGTLLPCIWEYTQVANPSSYISLVLTGKKDAFAFTFAADKDLPIRRLAQKSSEGETREEFSARVGQFIKEWLNNTGSSKYLVVSAGWKKIMTKGFFSLFEPRQMINTHPGLLADNPSDDLVTLPNGEIVPSSRNTFDPGPIEKALTDGHKWAGATVQYLVEETDAGEILLRGELPVERDDTLETLSARVYALEFKIVPQAIDLAIKKL